MKARVVSHCLLLASALAAPAQLILNPGDVWTQSFPFMSFQSGSNPGFVGLSGQLEVYFASFPSGTIRYEVWEGAPQGTPQGTGTISGSGQPGGLVAGFPGLWGDRNGSVRLTMLAGSCAISGVTCVNTVPTALNRYDKYAASLPLTPPPPRLALRQLPSTVEVSWWTNGSVGYVLDSASIPQSNQWAPVLVSPVLVSNRWVVTLGTNSTAYFRLRK